jgi:hypothetical protein
MIVMRKILLLFLFFPLLTVGQIDKILKLKLAVMQNCVAKGDDGETVFWQTKGKITFSIVNYTEEQNPIFKELFINQYKELKPIYQKMVVSEDTKDTSLYVKTLIKHEETYRNLLTKEQLKKYLDKLSDFEKNNPTAHDSYSSLFFSENLLNVFKTKFLLY